MGQTQKSKFAFRFSIERFTSEEVYMWTFTFKEVLDIEEGKRRWKALLRLLCKCWPCFGGFRVFELHPKGHGLHIHMVTDAWLDIDIVNALGERSGFGRINVKAIPRERASYLGKYLSKERPECFKGTRLWSPVGQIEGSKVRDIVVDSPWTRAYRRLGAFNSGFAKLPWGVRRYLVGQVVLGQSVHAVLAAYGSASLEKETVSRGNNDASPARPSRRAERSAGKLFLPRPGSCEDLAGGRSLLQYRTPSRKWWLRSRASGTRAGCDCLCKRGNRGLHVTERESI